jgi:hypothetical protein
MRVTPVYRRSINGWSWYIGLPIHTFRALAMEQMRSWRTDSPAVNLTRFALKPLARARYWSRLPGRDRPRVEHLAEWP